MAVSIQEDKLALEIFWPWKESTAQKLCAVLSPLHIGPLLAAPQKVITTARHCVVFVSGFYFACCSHRNTRLLVKVEQITR